MFVVLAALAAVAVSLAAYIRLAPIDASVWHVDPVTAVPAHAGAAHKVLPDADPAAPVFGLGAGELARAFDAVALADVRTRRVAGSPEDLHVTYVQRSRVLGFPDLVSVRFLDREDGGSTLAIFSRSRFGRSDFGVNRARVEKWLADLPASAR